MKKYTSYQKLQIKVAGLAASNIALVLYKNSLEWYSLQEKYDYLKEQWYHFNNTGEIKKWLEVLNK